MYPLSNLIYLVIYGELAHSLLGGSVSLAVALLAFSSIWIIYRYLFSALLGCRYPLTSSTLARLAFYILLCSLSAAVFSHVLEDYYVDWF
jgi:hypothetical protein